MIEDEVFGFELLLNQSVTEMFITQSNKQVIM